MVNKKCEICSKVFWVFSYRVRSAKYCSKRCQEKGKLIDMTGKRFGKWLVLERAGRDKGGNTLWLCKCECGKESAVRGNFLRRGLSKSCGCNALVTHGMARRNKQHPLYCVWISMKARCYNAKSKDYKRYGGRGIAVCERWRNSFVNFFADMAERLEGMSIDRIDNDRGYSPENCRWATKIEQNRNRKKNIVVTFKGQTKPLTEWAKELGINHSTLSWRLNKGWSTEKALTVPANKYNKTN